MATGFFEITPAAESLLFELAGTPPGGTTLLVVPRGMPLLGGASPNLRCIEIDPGHPELNWQAPAEPCQGAVIIPPFGVEVRAAPRTAAEFGIRRWSAEEYLIEQVWQHLAPGSRLVSFVSTGLLSITQREEARRLLLARGLRLVAHLPNEVLWRAEHAANTHMVLLVRDAEPAEFVTMIDLLDAEELPDAADLLSAMNNEPAPDLGTTPVRVQVRDLAGNTRLDPAFYEPAYLSLRAPAGYAEHALGDIAAGIISGVRMDAALRRTEPGPGDIPYVQVRHMQSDRLEDNDPFWISQAAIGPHRPKLALPNDILVSTGGTIGKVVLVGPGHVEGVLFDTSVRRVRLQDPAKAPAVAEFLRSDLGQMQFRRLTTGTIISHLTSAHLAQLRVFLPEAVPAAPPPGQALPPAPETPPATPEPLPELSPTQVYLNTLEGELQAILRQLSDGERPGWKEAIAEKLRRLAGDLVPPSLSERVRREFPAPLAIAYRRFQMATHNPYEQLDRMINLVEACVYFVFHVLVADYSKADWRPRFPLPKPAAEAIKPRAGFEHRIQFIRTLTELVRTNRLDLFVPRLVDCKVDQFADFFRVSLRNPVAHSAPGSEAYVARLVQSHVPKLEEMLGELAFLADYTMCRVRSHYYQRGRWHYQCEVYKGEEYDVNLQETLLETGPSNHLIAAERDHLVLLSAEYEALDLWPYYQLHYSDATCRESHLCYVKHFTASDKKLHGESVRSGIELELPGFDDYHRSANAATSGV